MRFVFKTKDARVNEKKKGLVLVECCTFGSGENSRFRKRKGKPCEESREGKKPVGRSRRRGEMISREWLWSSMGQDSRMVDRKTGKIGFSSIDARTNEALSSRAKEGISHERARSSAHPPDSPSSSSSLLPSSRPSPRQSLSSHPLDRASRHQCKPSPRSQLLPPKPTERIRKRAMKNDDSPSPVPFLLLSPREKEKLVHQISVSYTHL